MIQEHIRNNLSRFEEIFQKATSKIEALKVGERLPATTLAADLGKEYDLTGAQLYPVISLFLKGYPDIEIARGAKGGIVKLSPGSSKNKLAKLLAEEDTEMLDPNHLDSKLLPIINT
jgi:hypothetical protein